MLGQQEPPKFPKTNMIETASFKRFKRTLVSFK